MIIKTLSFLLGAWNVLALTYAFFAYSQEAVSAGPFPATTGQHSMWGSPCKEPFKVEKPFITGPNKYAAGQHRGIDISSPECADIVAPTDGTVHFSGNVAGKPAITLETGNGLLITFEPVESSLHKGDSVHAKDRIGVIAHGGQGGEHTIYVSVRKDGKYVNPLPLFKRLPRLLPWT